MNAIVSCRRLSPQLALALLLLVPVVISLPVSAAATVQGVTIATDRQTYFNVSPLNEVIATANVTFNGNGPLDRVRFEWFDSGASVPFLVHYVDAPALPTNP